MRVSLIAMGKMKASPEQELLHTYFKRLPWQVTIKEFELKKELSTEARREAEAVMLLQATEGVGCLIALDERGKHFSSEALAAQIGRWQQEGHSQLGIIIGGQDGLHASVRQRAQLVLSLGAVTWPHMLVRALIAEQLYRCHTILSGHPYHRA